MTEIIPVKLIFSDGTTFDPAPAPVVSSLQTSPVFTNAPFATGTMQYGDAVMRSEFWKFVAPSNYHVLLARPNIVTSWRHPDNHACNGSFLEVGDPVATRLFSVNGYTFEDAAFLSWLNQPAMSC